MSAATGTGAVTARTLLDDVPPRLMVVTELGDVLWQHVAESEQEISPDRADALLIGGGWPRSVLADGWEPEYGFTDEGRLILVGYATTVERIGT